MHRAFTAILVFASLLYGSVFLEQDSYLSILQIFFIVKFLQITNFGAPSGFFISLYAKEKVFKRQEKVFFVNVFSFHVLFISIILLSLDYLIIGNYIFPIMLFIFLIPVFTSEPLFRSKKKFYFSLVPDLVLSISLLLTILYFEAIGGVPKNSINIYITITFILILFANYYLVHKNNVKFFSLKYIKISNLKEYVKIIKLGFPIYLATAFFIIISGFDRLLLPWHASVSEQAIYMLAYQVSIGSMLLLSSLNFTNTVLIGEQFKEKNKIKIYFFLKKIFQSGILAIISLSILLVLAFVLESFFLEESYNGLTKITMIISIGMSFFYISGSVTPLLAYMNRQITLTTLMGVASLVIMVNNVITIKLDFGIIWLAIFTSCVMGLIGIVAILYTYLSINKFNYGAN